MSDLDYSEALAESAQLSKTQHGRNFLRALSEAFRDRALEKIDGR
jgi:hypothetical protein